MDFVFFIMSLSQHYCLFSLLNCSKWFLNQFWKWIKGSIFSGSRSLCFWWRGLSMQIFFTLLQIGIVLMWLRESSGCLIDLIWFSSTVIVRYVSGSLSFLSILLELRLQFMFCLLRRICLGRSGNLQLLQSSDWSGKS